MKQINPQILNKWKRGGELIAIFRCERCFKKIPLYKTDNALVNSIYLSFAGHEKYCPKCKMNKPNIKKNLIRREIILLARYEGVIEKEPEVIFDFLN